MKKLLSLILAITVIAATLVCAMPMSISAAEAPIEATPLEISEIGRGWQYVAQPTTTTPLGFTTATGLIVKQNSNYTDTYPHESADDAVYSSTHFRYASMLYSQGKLFGASTSIIIYVKTDAANQIVPYISFTSTTGEKTINGTLSPKVGTEYQYAAIGDSEWTTAQFAAGAGESLCFGKVSFDKAFEGYIKIPYTSLAYDNNMAFVFNPETDYVTGITYYFKGLGSNGLATSDSTTVYGSAVIGPVFVVTKDSTSTKINVPAEWQTAPIAATPIVGWTHTGASGITRSEVAPIKTATLNGIKATATTAFDLGDGLAGSQHKFVAMNFAEYSLADTEGFIVYIKTDSANQIIFSAAAAGFGYGTANTVEGRSFYTMSKGAVSWETKTITAGSTDKYFAALKFDEAFEGYVKIPYASLGASGSYSVFNNTYSITQIAFRFRALGGDFGSAIVGPVSTYKADSTSTEIVYPDEFKPQPIKAIPLVGFTKGTAYWDTVNRDLVTPATTGKFTVANGIKLSSYDGTQKEFAPVNTSKVLAQAIYADHPRDGYQMPADFASKGSLIVYVKTNSANKMHLQFSTTYTASNYSATADSAPNAAYEYVAIGDDEWTSAITDENGAFCFSKAFEGYVKVPATSFKSNVTMNFNFIGFMGVRFEGIGGTYGEVIAGPFFATTDNSSSTVITVDEQYAPQPLDVKSFDFREVRASGYNFSASKIENTNNYKLYIDEDSLSETPVKFPSEDKKWSYVENADGKVASGRDTPLVMTPTVDTYMKDAIGMVFYVKFDKPNAFALSLTFDGNDNRVLTLKPGQKVQVLANGSDEWTEKVIDIGDNAFADIYGMVSFDSAFEGYIKVPFTSCNNDGGFMNRLILTGDNMSALTDIALRFKGIGDDTMYGSEVVAGVSGYYTEDTAKAEIGSIAAPEYAEGDVNYDWKVNSTDIVAASKSLLGIEGYAGYEVESILELIRLKKLLAN